MFVWVFYLNHLLNIIFLLESLSEVVYLYTRKLAVGRSLKHIVQDSLYTYFGPRFQNWFVILVAIVI